MIHRVCAHAGYVAHVIAHVIGNSGGLRGSLDIIPLLPTRSAPVRGLGIDAATTTLRAAYWRPYLRKASLRSFPENNPSD